MSEEMRHRRPLQSIQEANGQGLAWTLVDPAVLGYELSVDDARVAWLEVWPGPEALGKRAFAQTAEGGWNVELKEWRGLGVFPKLIARSTSGAGVDAWEWTRNWRHVWKLTTAHGRSLSWRRASVTKPDWVCLDESGAPLVAVVVSCAGTLGALVATVRLDPSARGVPELALVLTLGWFITVIPPIEGDEG